MIEMVPLVLAPLLAGAFASSATWYALRARRRARRRAFRRELFDACDADAQAALEVAFHEAETRGRGVSAVDVLWGLLQVDTFTAAVQDLDSSVNEIERRVLEALDGSHAELASGAKVLAPPLARARAFGTTSSCTALWLGVCRTRAANLVEVASLTTSALSFRLVHGVREPSAEAAGVETLVVLRNDDYTTIEFVVSMLREVFDLTTGDAQQLANQVGERGRGVVGRFPAAEGTAKVEAARALARRDGHPLWIGVEPS